MGLSLVTGKELVKASLCWSQNKMEGDSSSKQREEGAILINRNNRSCHHLCKNSDPGLGLGASLTRSHWVHPRSQRLCLVSLLPDKEIETQRGSVTYLGHSAGKWQRLGGDLHRGKCSRHRETLQMPRKGRGQKSSRTEGKQWDWSIERGQWGTVKLGSRGSPPLPESPLEHKPTVINRCSLCSLRFHKGEGKRKRRKLLVSECPVAELRRNKSRGQNLQALHTLSPVCFRFQYLDK